MMMMKMHINTKLTAPQRAALKWVRDQLAAGMIQDGGLDDEPNGQNLFNITHIVVRGPCGTVACIGGWMAIRQHGIEPEDGLYILTAKDDTDVYQVMREAAISNDRLYELFYPSKMYWDDIRAEHAVKAIDNVLAGRGAGWRLIMPPLWLK